MEIAESISLLILLITAVETWRDEGRRAKWSMSTITAWLCIVAISTGSAAKRGEDQLMPLRGAVQVANQLGILSGPATNDMLRREGRVGAARILHGLYVGFRAWETELEEQLDAYEALLPSDSPALKKESLGG